jgi:hypothetical protein
MPIKRKSCSKGQIRNPKTGKCIKRNKDKKNSNKRNKGKKNSNKGNKSNKDKKNSKKGKKNSRGVAGTTFTSRDKINIIINYKVKEINKIVDSEYELQYINHTYKDSIKKFLEEEEFINELFSYYIGPPITKNSLERPSVEIEPNLDIKITLNNYKLNKRVIRQKRLKFLIKRSLNAHLEVWNEDKILLESGEVLILDDIDIDDIDIKINTSSVIS